MNRSSIVFEPELGELSIEEAARRSKLKFVRSEGQLAVYKEWKKPTGHIMTAWEAFNAYGVEKLEEASEYGTAVLKQKRDSTERVLRDSRKRLNVKQERIEKAAGIVGHGWMKKAEEYASDVDPIHLAQIAFVLGLDDRKIAVTANAGGDEGLAYRLRRLRDQREDFGTKLTPTTALLFSEAASIIRVQLRLQEWLDVGTEFSSFSPENDYGGPNRPPWRVGFDLAKLARTTLDLGSTPIKSMRELVEDRLGIPVVQVEIGQDIAGATVATMDENGKQARGIVLNTKGKNSNVRVRRATIAHELGHLLYDPDQQLDHVHLDSYQESGIDSAQEHEDRVEQRANAFAIAFLAPPQAVTEMVGTELSEEDVSAVVEEFGISHIAAQRHIQNIQFFGWGGTQYESSWSRPSQEMEAAESFTVDYFPIRSTPIQRRGKFGEIVMKCHDRNLISEDTACLYFRCSHEEFQGHEDSLRSIYNIG